MLASRWFARMCILLLRRQGGELSVSRGGGRKPLWKEPLHVGLLGRDRRREVALLAVSRVNTLLRESKTHSVEVSRSLEPSEKIGNRTQGMNL